MIFVLFVTEPMLSVTSVGAAAADRKHIRDRHPQPRAHRTGAAEPEMDDRKRMGMKVLVVTSVLFAMSCWVKRYKWAYLKSRKIVYDPPKVSSTRK